MKQPERITLVLRACDASPLSNILPYAEPGQLASAGRGLAAIVSITEGDLQAKLAEREEQLKEADVLLREAIAFINEYQGNDNFRDMLIARIDKLIDRDKEPESEEQP
ncbi:hypothetical protein GEV38_21770 [Pseudomonas sp. 13159349]|uniref:hypothetical protein n=1 Tax=Pseudomonas sp. 13159349 TaxID=2662034 RepID=UPI001570E063|nr:hypothetical protein [Pseudomonas sp. 13159349]QKK98433.1 hypothetical protein GEV38_21770 [Pseudomonas sp. 13159349]